MSFLKSLKGYLTYLKISKNNEEKKCVYIYSEGLNYRNYFIEIIESLHKKKLKFYILPQTKKI